MQLISCKLSLKAMSLNSELSPSCEMLEAPARLNIARTPARINIVLISISQSFITYSWPRLTRTGERESLTSILLAKNKIGTLLEAISEEK